MKKKVLIIDDSMECIQMLASTLQNDYQVITAQSGKEGLRLYRLVSPSIILLDVIMPDMSGFDVLKQLKEEDKTFCIPVIFITGLQDEKSEEKGLSLGAVDYIMKPFHPKIMKVKVQNHIRRMQYRKNMENIAMLDGLTGIPNRRSYDLRFQLDYRYCMKHRVPLSMAIADIDYFKEYNDNYGHLKGDQVLREIASFFREKVDQLGGYVARYGGEEFVFLFRNVERAQASVWLEEIREGVESLQIHHLYSKSSKQITISIGGHTIVPEEEDKATEFAERVDQRLYQAKSQGKNQLVWENRSLNNGQIEAFMLNEFSVLSGANRISVKTGMQKKSIILFAYLIVNRYEEYTKEDLYHAVYPSEEMEESRLAVIYTKLKKDLERLNISYARELIVPIHGVYHWNNNYMCIVDAELFQHLCEQIHETKDNTERVSLSKRAIDLYQSDFMNEILDVTWIQELREDYREKYREALHYYLEDAAKKEDYKRIIHICSRDILNHVQDEEIHYYYLLALIRSKKQKEAIEHYEYILESYYAINQSALSKRITKLYHEIEGLNPVMKQELLKMKEQLSMSVADTGAFECSYPVFEKVYQIEARNIVRNETMCYLCMLHIDEVPDDKILLPMDQLRQVLKVNLRVGDAFAKMSTNKYVLLLPNVNYKYGNLVMQRIKKAFQEALPNETLRLQYELVPVEPTSYLPH